METAASAVASDGRPQSAAGGRPRTEAQAAGPVAFKAIYSEVPSFQQSTCVTCV